MQNSCTMKGCTVLSLLLLMKLTISTQDRFFISAPNVFHVGVKEKVFVQIEGESDQNCVPVKLWLDHLQGGLVSNMTHVGCDGDKKPKIAELMINSEIWLELKKTFKNSPPHLELKAERRVNGRDPQRKATKVLVLERRGYIFIQTDQPIYNPTQKVKYRIFTLDHSFRPSNEPIFISIYNAAGNRILHSLRVENGGIHKDMFSIPSVSKMGTWKIAARYENGEENAAVREFKVEQFVMPSFDVNILLEKKYILLTDEHLTFTISAMYSYGEEVKGAYHCQFGVVEKGETNKENITPNLTKGLEVANSVQNGSATVSIPLERIRSEIEENLKLNFSEFEEKKQQLFVGVFVTNIQNGEIQEAKVYLPVYSKKYKVDFSRTRSYFVHGYPLDLVVDVRFPDGSPAANVPVMIEVRNGESTELTTNEDGAVIAPFSLKNVQEVTFQVTVDGQQENKKIERSSPRQNYLYMTYTNKVYSVKENFKVTFNTFNTLDAQRGGNIYYMILSRGNIISTGIVPFGVFVTQTLQITAAMVPSFRLVGYYYDRNGGIIADSIWVDVKDECEIEVKVQTQGQNEPRTLTHLEFDLHGQKATVALLAVDKAIYALKTDNKLTAQQVFTTMQSYDLGCSSSGGLKADSALMEAGLTYFTQSKADWRRTTECHSQTSRRRRSIDLQQEMTNLKSDYQDPELQSCCAQAFSPIPMNRTCKERAARVSLMGASKACADAFEKCCQETEKLRRRKILEEGQSGFGRSASTTDIEEFFKETTNQVIRRYFPPSFTFTDFPVDKKRRFIIALPDSITTWEIQVATFSPTSGLCVVKPQEIKAFQKSFVSLRLPYSVKKYEQLSVTPVIYNYDDKELKVAVHMEQTEGLCSPASATDSSFVTTVVKPHSSQFVSFTAVPMVTGSIPIKIRLFDIEREWGIDAEQKNLLVKAEGSETRQEETQPIQLDGSTKTIYINGTIPDNTVPESSSNIFISVEGEGFCISQAKNLLIPEKVSSLINLPSGCLEQTMSKFAPTTLAMRYLDLSDQWFNLKPGERDVALSYIEHGYMRILDFKKKETGAYSAWSSVPYSTWVTALVVKMLSLVTELQSTAIRPNSQILKVVPEKEITEPVKFLLSVQKDDGTFGDPYPMVHRNTMTGTDEDAAMTAFITLALNRSLQFLPDELHKSDVIKSISKATQYLQLQLENIKHPYAVAITSYCLSACLSEERNHLAAWRKLQSMVKKADSDRYFWSDDPNMENKELADGITIQTNAYALLTAVQLEERMWADKIARWLISQENYNGGFRSTHDTTLALEALSEYELKKSSCSEANVDAEFSVPGKDQVVRLTMKDNTEKVETELKSLTGNIITVQLTGTGNIKFKTVKAFHLLDPEDDCSMDLSVSVTVEGKVEYTAEILKNYDYVYDDETDKDGARVSRSADNWFDSHTRSRRDLENDLEAHKVVTYRVCVSRSPTRNLTGMAIADITLLSGFEAKKEDLEKLKLPPEQYITHYELSDGKVVIYFNKLFEETECIAFDAEQFVPVGLLQPAPALFYDYYEPSRKCRIFYSAPRRSKLISKLCSDDVCQCAERPCYKAREGFKLLESKSSSTKKFKKADRFEHACFYPVVDYAYIVIVNSVSQKSNFELYKANIASVLKSSRDLFHENAARVFAKRLQCKGQLDLGQQYLIMGKDGSTTDTDGKMQYLLESNTWVEKMPSAEFCKKSANTYHCNQLNQFIEEYKINGCTQ